MTSILPNINSFFTCFDVSVQADALPERFVLLTDNIPHSLCALAANQIQEYLKSQQEWNHNFGLLEDKEGTVIGKMFGVLVVKIQQGEIGYLAAFSGKLAGSNHHAKFVPPIYDGLSDGGFLNDGMKELASINEKIKELEALKAEEHKEQIDVLKTVRKNHSVSLQNELFEQYHFLNRAGEEKSLQELFQKAMYKNPPAGAGECAAPKLLQYAFQHQMKPIALAEFWWGLSPKSDNWKHGEFYPCCREKCEPILAHMLAGIDVEE